MNHEQAVRQSATERYLMGELSPESRDEFEEHFFECSECAHDVRAGSLFIEQSKRVLAEKPEPVAVPQRVPASASAGFLAWLRPAWAVPVFAMLLGVLGYQNLVTYPQLRASLDQPQVLSWVSLNTRTRGSSTTSIAARRGKPLVLFVNIPPDPRYTQYFADIYNPAGKIDASLPVALQEGEDTVAIQIPTGNRQPGTYAVALRGIDSSGQNKEISRTQFELGIEK
jgi:Putative zinc-finger